MFRKKLVTLMMITVLATSFVACGDKSVASSSNDGTSTASTEQQTTKSPEQESSEKASQEELSKKAEEAKVSMAAAIEKAAQEENSKAQEEAQSKAQSSKAEVESQAAVQVSEQIVGDDGEVVTVVDSYGIDSARAQYSANYSIYAELVRLTNELRASLGVSPLTMEENICIASCKKAVDYYVAGYYDGPNHTMIDGRRWQALYEDFNIPATNRAENLAQGPAYKTAQQMFEGWKNSSVHYTNMVNPSYTRVGVGSCGYVWFMDFAG